MNLHFHSEENKEDVETLLVLKTLKLSFNLKVLTLIFSFLGQACSLAYNDLRNVIRRERKGIEYLKHHKLDASSFE